MASAADIRIDSGVEVGSVVTPFFDSLIAKMIAWGADREAALRNLVAALAATKIAPLTTNIGALQRLVSHVDFASGAYDTQFVSRCLGAR
jgi:3-methylcrotonyl-CoA carboxylase alpha subunit